MLNKLLPPVPNPFIEAPPVISNKGKIVIIVPVSHHIEPYTDQSLRVLEIQGVTVWREYGWSAIDQGRSALTQKAVDEGFEHIIQIDADVGFYPDDIFKLVGHNLPICAACYSVKGWPVLTTEFLHDGEYVFGPQGGLHEVKYVATGFLYTHRSVYEKVAAHFKMERVKIWGGQYNSHPFYLPQIINNNGSLEYLGEDFSWIHRCREAGYKVYVDTTIRLTHIGKYGYSFAFLEDGARKEPESIVYVQRKSNY